MTDVTEIQKQVAALGTSWEDFKKKNDERLSEIDKKGVADPLIKAALEKMNGFMDSTKADMDAKQKLIDEQKAKIETLETVYSRPGTGAVDGKAEKPEMTEYKKAFMSYIRKGRDEGLENLQVKALSVQSDPDGGYVVTPDMNGKIVQRIYETSPIRQIADVQTISTDTLEGMNDLDQAAGGWTSETGARTETSTPQLGKWQIPVREIYAAPKATQKLLDDANMDMESWLATKQADIFARLENAAFVNGNGVSQPTGFTTYTTSTSADASRSWGTLQHIGTGVNGDFAASNPADSLIDLITAFKPALLPNASIVTRRTVTAKMRKFKDTTGQYLWQPSIQAGQPDRIFGYPIFMAEDMPALAANSLSLAMGDFKQGYQIVDRMGIRTLRDPFTAKPFVIFYSTKRVGGGVINSEAIKFLKFA